MNAAKRVALWERLRQEGLVEGELPARGEVSSPWFVRLMLGFAGWLGAVFLVAFVATAAVPLVKKEAGLLVLGAGACAVAAVLFRRRAGQVWLGQFGFAIGLAGQGLLAWGFVRLSQASVLQATTYLALQQAALFLLLPNTLHRIWAAGSGAVLAMVSLAYAGGLPFAPVLVTAAFVWTQFREVERADRSERIRAAGYGLAFATAVAALAAGATGGRWFFGSGGLPPPWGGDPGRWAGIVASGLVLPGVTVLLLRRAGLAPASGPGRFCVVLAALVAAASLKAPGLAPAAVILVIGFAHGNRVLAGFGLAVLLAYLSHYYYSLQVTLLVKSGLLLALGLGLLGLRLVLPRWWPAPEREPDA